MYDMVMEKHGTAPFLYTAEDTFWSLQSLEKHLSRRSKVVDWLQLTPRMRNL
jgi:hypothetical protein